MTFNEILNDIRNRKFYPVYILMGEEPYYIDKISEALEASVIPEEERDFNFNVMYGADVKPETVLTAAQQYPVMAERQMVMFKEAQSMQRAKTVLDALIPYVEKPTLSTVLVVVFKGDSVSAKLQKAATKNSKNVVLFNSPQIRDYNLPTVVKDYCKSNKISIEPKAIEMICEFVGTNLTNLFSELEKLLIAEGKGTLITPELIEKNIGYSKDFNNLELTTALANRNYAKAVRIVKYFRDNPRSNPTVVTTGTLFSYFQKLVIANFTADKSESNLVKMLGLKNSYGLKNIRPGMASYNAMQTLRAISLIREFDTKSKGIDSMQKEYDLLLELVFKLVTL